MLDNRRWEPMPAIEKLSHRSCYPAHRSRSTDIPVTRPSGGLPTLAKRFLRPLPLLQHEKQQQPTAAQPFALLHRQKYAFMDGTGLGRGGLHFLVVLVAAVPVSGATVVAPPVLVCA